MANLNDITPEAAVGVFAQMRAKFTASGDDHDIALRSLQVLSEFIKQKREEEAKANPVAQFPAAGSP